VSKATLRRGVFRATIVPDRFLNDSLFHYVVQRKASKEILAWGQESSQVAARNAALRQIEFLQESEKKFG
jgi:hypothetical protein